MPGLGSTALIVLFGLVLAAAPLGRWQRAAAADWPDSVLAVPSRTDGNALEQACVPPAQTSLMWCLEQLATIAR